MKIRVLLVEDQKIMQKYFASMVQGDERFLLVDVLNDGEKAVSYCNHTVVDLVLMDVQTFQNHDGLLAAETIKKQHPAVKIIVITSLVDPEILTRAKEKGADSLWYKDHGQNYGGDRPDFGGRTCLSGQGAGRGTEVDEKR